jgi:hypothetical protein
MLPTALTTVTLYPNNDNNGNNGNNAVLWACRSPFPGHTGKPQDGA